MSIKTYAATPVAIARPWTPQVISATARAEALTVVARHTIAPFPTGVQGTSVPCAAIASDRFGGFAAATRFVGPSAWSPPV